MFKGLYSKGGGVESDKKKYLDVAVKRITKEMISEGKYSEEAINNEIKIQEMITDREFILGYHGHWEVEGDHYFAYDYCLWGDVTNTRMVRPGKVLS